MMIIINNNRCNNADKERGALQFTMRVNLSSVLNAGQHERESIILQDVTIYFSTPLQTISPICKI